MPVGTSYQVPRREAGSVVPVRTFRYEQPPHLIVVYLVVPDGGYSDADLIGRQFLTRCRVDGRGLFTTYDTRLNGIDALWN